MIESTRFDPSHEEVRKAVEYYLKEGGKIESAREQARKDIKEEIRNQLVQGNKTVSAKTIISSKRMHVRF